MCARQRGPTPIVALYWLHHYQFTCAVQLPVHTAEVARVSQEPSGHCSAAAPLCPDVCGKCRRIPAAEH
eukprot:7417907-Alexandrium_andersonii.AAC.1